MKIENYADYEHPRTGMHRTSKGYAEVKNATNDALYGAMTAACREEIVDGETHFRVVPENLPAALAAAREARQRGLGTGNNPRWRGLTRLIGALLGGWATAPDVYGYNKSRIERFNPAEYE